MKDYYNSKIGLLFVKIIIPYGTFLLYPLLLISCEVKINYLHLLVIVATMELIKLIAILIFRKIGPYKISLNTTNNKITFFLPYRGGEKEYNFSDIEKINDQSDQLRFKCKNGKVFIFDIFGRKEDYILEMVTTIGCEFISTRFK